jgi:predicted GIY-YIG superfamily endonuclease
MIYILLLEQNKWYIGYTDRKNGERFIEHFTGIGAKWTQLYKPIQVMEWREGTIEDENIVTLEYMQKYGWWNVRGGSYCQVDMTKPPSKLLLMAPEIIKPKIKPTKQSHNTKIIDLSNTYTINDDQEFVNMILNKLNDDIIICNNKIFLLDDTITNNKYLYCTIANKKNAIKYISKIIESLNIKKISYTNKNYKGTPTSISLLQKNIYDHIKCNNDFITNCQKQNEYKICFLNGYYDILEKKFNNYDKPFNSFMYIQRNYEEPNKKDIDQVYEILNKLCNSKQIKIMLNWFSRGLAGKKYDKTISFGIAKENCRNIIFTLLQNAFGNYVNTFCVNDLITITSKSYRNNWLLNSQYYRLLLCNDIKTYKTNILDGYLLKYVMSGNPLMEYNEYGTLEKFTFNARIIFFMNEMAKINSYDIFQNINVIEFNNNFENELIKKNNSVNFFNIIKKEKFLNAFCKIIFDNYGESLYNKAY